MRGHGNVPLGSIRRLASIIDAAELVPWIASTLLHARPMEGGTSRPVLRRRSGACKLARHGRVAVVRFPSVAICTVLFACSDSKERSFKARSLPPLASELDARIARYLQPSGCPQTSFCGGCGCAAGAGQLPSQALPRQGLRAHLPPLLCRVPEEAPPP